MLVSFFLALRDRGDSELLTEFVIANEESNEIIKNLEFGDTFEVLVDGNWVKTQLEIGSNDKGEMIFNLKGTPFKEFITGVDAR